VWLRLFGFNGWFSSLEGEGLSAAAFALKPLLQLSSRSSRRLLSLLLERLPAGHPEFVIPQAFRCEVIRARESGTRVPFVRRYNGFSPEQNVTASST
jgi:hypothetical protein